MARIVCFAVLLGVAYTASTPPFKCTGSEDVCNVYGVDQYCGPAPGGYKRCIDCSNKKQSCGSTDMPQECYNYCIQQAVLNEKERPCPPLPDVLHGYHNGLTKVTHTVGTVVSVTCNHGYDLVGGDTVNCTDYGQWSGYMPVCQQTLCAKPLTLLYGHILAQSNRYPVGLSIQYKCNTGFVLHGTSKAICGTDGQWNVTQMPTCNKETSCTMPPNPMHGVIKTRHQLENGQINLTVGTSITFECEDRHTLKGEATWTCTPGGTWDHNTMSVCVENTMGDMALIIITAAVTVFVIFGFICIVWKYQKSTKKQIIELKGTAFEQTEPLINTNGHGIRNEDLNNKGHSINNRTPPTNTNYERTNSSPASLNGLLMNNDVPGCCRNNITVSQLSTNSTCTTQSSSSGFATDTTSKKSESINQAKEVVFIEVNNSIINTGNQTDIRLANKGIIMERDTGVKSLTTELSDDNSSDDENILDPIPETGITKEAVQPETVDETDNEDDDENAASDDDNDDGDDGDGGDMNGNDTDCTIARLENEDQTQRKTHVPIVNVRVIDETRPQDSDARL